jgi:SecD/SecF fusion protein
VTSLSTLLPVAALMFFGGETLQDFGFALLVGVASGTYSSVFIAGPVLSAWKERERVYRRRRALIMEESGGVVPAYASGTVGGDGPSPSRTIGAARTGAPATGGDGDGAARQAAPVGTGDGARTAAQTASPSAEPESAPAPTASATRAGTPPAVPAPPGSNGERERPDDGATRRTANRRRKRHGRR